jgi:DNA-binding SARP family transcriptional activator
VRFGILGPFEALDDAGSELALGGAKQRALFALLLLNAREVVSTDRIVDEIWGAKPPSKPAHTVQVYVSNIRKALGDAGRGALITRAPGYILELEPSALDLTRFEEALNDGRVALVEGRFRDAADRLRQGLEEWRGAPLAEFAYESFAQAAIARLEELRLVALEERFEADLALGRHGELVPELQHVVGQQPLRERPRGQLMLALYRAGRQAEALEVFHETRAALVEHLGIDPSPALQVLEHRILNHDPELAVAVLRWPELPEGIDRAIARALAELPEDPTGVAASSLPP